MKNRINLYTLEMKPKLQILTLSVTCVLWAAALIVTLFVYSHLGNQNQTLQAESVALAARKAEKSALVASLAQKLATRVKDQQLVNNIEQKQITLRLKGRVLSELAGQESLKASGFSGLMLALASTSETGIWLTQIKLNGRKFSIEGGALESSSVPKWLANLGTTEFFIGQEFATTRMYRDPQQQLFFVLDSQYSDLSEGGSADER